MVKLVCPAISVALAVLGLALLTMLLRPQKPGSEHASIKQGGSFELHEQIRLTSTPRRPTVLTPNQFSNLVYNCELMMPIGSTLEHESVGYSSSPGDVRLSIDGIVRTSTNVSPGRKTIKLRVPGITNPVPPPSPVFAFPPDAKRVEPPCTWIVYEFDVSKATSSKNRP
jgi:hypothetical protein